MVQVFIQKHSYQQLMHTFKLSHGSGYDPRLTVLAILEKLLWPLFNLSVSYGSRATRFELGFTVLPCER